MTDDHGTSDATSSASTTTSSATDDTTASGATPSPSDDKGNSDALGDPGARALAAERDRVKALEVANAQMRDRLAELEDAGKSEAERERNARERAEQRANEAEQRLVEYERVEAKRRIATEVGLPLELADRLQGDDDRQLRADAKRLLDLTAPNEGRLAAGRGSVTPARGADDMNALIRQASGRG